jgi:cytidylate kinase
VQLQAAGVDVSMHRLTEEIEERDRLDRSRAVSPLIPAPDARVVDSSDLSADAVVATICEIAERARASA